VIRSLRSAETIGVASSVARALHRYTGAAKIELIANGIPSPAVNVTIM